MEEVTTAKSGRGLSHRTWQSLFGANLLHDMGVFLLTPELWTAFGEEGVTIGEVCCTRAGRVALLEGGGDVLIVRALWASVAMLKR